MLVRKFNEQQITNTQQQQQKSEYKWRDVHLIIEYLIGSLFSLRTSARSAIIAIVLRSSANFNAFWVVLHWLLCVRISAFSCWFSSSNSVISDFQRLNSCRAGRGRPVPSFTLKYKEEIIWLMEDCCCCLVVNAQSNSRKYPDPLAYLHFVLPVYIGNFHINLLSWYTFCVERFARCVTQLGCFVAHIFFFYSYKCNANGNLFKGLFTRNGFFLIARKHQLINEQNIYLALVKDVNTFEWITSTSVLCMNLPAACCAETMYVTNYVLNDCQ